MLLQLPLTPIHAYFHLWTTDIKKNGLWWPNRYYHSPTIIISQIYIVQFFPTSLTGLNTTHKVIFYTMLKSLLGNDMLYNSWVHVLPITYFWSPTIYWKPSVTNHFDLFVITKDENQHVFQSCIALVKPFMANTMSTDCFRKKWIQFLKLLLLFLTSNITIIVDTRHGTWIKQTLFICYTVTVVMVNKNKFTN